LISWQVDLVRVDLIASWSCESWSRGNWFRENWSCERKPLVFTVSSMFCEWRCESLGESITCQCSRCQVCSVSEGVRAWESLLHVSVHGVKYVYQISNGHFLMLKTEQFSYSDEDCFRRLSRGVFTVIAQIT